MGSPRLTKLTLGFSLPPAHGAGLTGADHETGASKGKLYEYRDGLTGVWRVSEDVLQTTPS